MSQELLLVLVGAGVALVSSLLTLVLSHFLSLREAKDIREALQNEARNTEAVRRFSVYSSDPLHYAALQAIAQQLGDAYPRQGDPARRNEPEE